MDEVEVDPQLFVKCRLCLKDTGGMFQIVPKVRDQIKFCFDIEVEQFDGLPQLICKICRTKLNEYYITKTMFTENQKTLKLEISMKQEINIQNMQQDCVPNICNSPQQTTVTSSQEIDIGSKQFEVLEREINAEIKEVTMKEIDTKKEIGRKDIFGELDESENDEIKMIKPRKKRPCLRLSSASSEDVNQRRSASPIIKQKKKYGNKSWKNNFHKRIFCLLCQKQCKTKGHVGIHLTKHAKIISKYEDVFAKCCTVTMNRIDDKPNLTGSLSKVVYDSTKITGHAHKKNIAYYVVYSPKVRINNTPSPTIEHVESSEDELLKKRGSKRVRLLSRSSNETVVLEKDSKTSPVPKLEDSKNKDITPMIDPPECINIDDSSNSDMDITSSEVDSSVKPKYTDYNQIQNIISICRNKFSKKIESVEHEIQTENLLKHKILNMGRKVINKQGFNCTGLLRFMEHKNLDIVWTPTDSTPINNVNKETNYVRILPKLKGKEKLKNDKWNRIPRTQEKGVKELDIDDNLVSVEEINSTVNIGLADIAHGESILSSSNGNVNDHAVLYANSNDVEINKNKLLNANPVANPKQLPKKAITIESKSNNKKDSSNIQHPTEMLLQEENVDLCMPIITSTTSLAIPSATENEPIKNNNESGSVVNEVEKSVPRIKVKPVSELMSERVLKNLTQQQIDYPSNIWNINSEVNATVPQPSIANAAIITPADISPASSASNLNEKSKPPQATHREYVILHTPELPNHKTEWPFKYLKELLYIHSIILLDPNDTIPKNFTCLIKFKLQYKQENVAQPVILLITFSCSGNTFHLGVKHSGQENIDLNQLPANWQWEILNKIYQEEVVNKVLKNAQKINSVTYDYTKKFFCLLKSIQCKKFT